VRRLAGTERAVLEISTGGRSEVVVATDDVEERVMKETAVAVCVSLLLIAAVASPGQAPASRRAVSSGRPIIDQLRPDDRELTLEINAYPPFVLPAPPGQSRLAWPRRSLRSFSSSWWTTSVRT
jgi:hypothetical protein